MGSYRRSISDSDFDLTLSALKQLGNLYGTSPEATMRRLSTLGLATTKEYEWFRNSLREHYDSLPKRDSSGGPSRELLVLRNVGERYAESVLEARQREVISDLDAAKYMFAKVRWLDPVEELLARR